MMRLIRNLRYTPRGRPVSSQRRTVLLENLGFRLLLAIWALVAMRYLLLPAHAPAGRLGQFFSSGLVKGIPSFSSTNWLRSGLELANDMLMFMPCVKVASAMLISGNTPCSFRPME